MKFFGKLLLIATYILLLLNVLIFIGTVTELLHGWVGFFGYILWIIVAPILSPALIVLPWFESWVSGDPVNQRLLIIWLAWVACLILRAVTWKFAPDK